MENTIVYELKLSKYVLALATISTGCLLIIAVQSFIERPSKLQSVRVCDFDSCADVNYGALVVSGEVKARIVE